MKSTLSDNEPAGLHVAIIMDGSGRWAAARGLPRLDGHRAGAEAVRRVVEAAARSGVGTLTLYAFSQDNWRRPAAEVQNLMRLFREHLVTQAPVCAERGLRLSVMGRRDRLGPLLRAAIATADMATAAGAGMHLRLAVDYSARDAIAAAAGACGGETPTRDEFARRLGAATGCAERAPDVDLLIRTGGELRLSDFLLWECAYAELCFTPRLWPDFGAADLEQALAEFGRRERRFGGLPQARAG